jgi:hypothetical protein
MADYYTIIAKAVAGLDPNTCAARQRLYDRARVALVAEMRSAHNALDESDILAAQRSLEEAIERIEADTEPDEPADQPADMPLAHLPRGVVEAPYPPANQNGEQRRSPLRRLWTHVFHRAGDSARGNDRFGGRGAVLASRFPVETHREQVRDTWLTDLLARASREEEDDDQTFAPQRVVRRSQ